MTYHVAIYVDSYGRTYGAAETDQAGYRTVNGRTVNGRPVVYAGQWYGSQMSYRPFETAVQAAAKKAAALES